MILGFSDVTDDLQVGETRKVFFHNTIKKNLNSVIVSSFFVSNV